VFYRIIGPDGRTLTGYDDLPAPQKPAAGPPMLYDARYSGEPVRIAAALRQVSEPGVAGTVRILVAQTVIERNALARDIALKAALLLATIAIVAIALAVLAVRYALAPLTNVQRALLSRSPNDLSPFVIETPRELETMVGALNRFIFRLDRRVESVQSFVADAAHQLRTPIAAIRAQAEIAIGEEKPERLKRINRRILDRSIAVGRLAEQLLSRAMITHRSDAAELQPIDLRRVAIEAERETHRLSAAGGEPIFCDLCEHPVTVNGDAFSLREAVKNLVTNAQIHGKPPIRIRVDSVGGKAHLSVLDHGPGISTDLGAKFGARFARTDRSSPSGTGLGLAIAHDVAQFHSGELAFGHRDGEFEIALILPVAAARP
jgi:two-component system sensor histidine kinase TctE